MNKSSDGKSNILTGIISTTRKGVGYIDDVDPKKDSIYIEEGSLNTALNGDTVQFTVYEGNVRGQKTKMGKVVKVVGRAKETFVGAIKIEDSGGSKGAISGAMQSVKPKTHDFLVVPDDKKMYVNISIPRDQGSEMKEDDKVYVKMLPWTDPKVLPTGQVIKVLGKKGVNDVEMESIVLERGFEIAFPEAVEKEAEKIELNEKKIAAEEISKRRDIRNTLTFTIDPYDAKDFDDAISFREVTDEFTNGVSPDRELVEPRGFSRLLRSEAEQNEGRNPERRERVRGQGVRFYEIGIHIADVSHYVREDTALNSEAIKRGCSIYLVDRTIPMLPEALSNDVCSLNPREDKLSFSAIFVMDDKAKIHSRWFGRTVMNSAHRFTYEAAQAVMDGDASNVVKYSGGIQNAASAQPGMKYRPELTTLNRLAKILQKEKFSKGAIEFEQDEIKFQLDGEGKPINVYKQERLDTHKLVEEYMLVANREVAKYIYDSIKKKGKRDTGAIYRVHDVPDKDKIKNLSLFVKALGYELKTNKEGHVAARDINHLLDQIEGTPHESLVRAATIRSMQKAIYSTRNIGHFGLAFEFYTHFTSPIRRYPDLLVHRVLAKHLNNEPFNDADAVAFQRIAETSTAKEIDAAIAERSSKKLKQVEYMMTRVGRTFAGVISGATKWGVYVEENETKSEGMIAIRHLGPDYFIFDEKTYSIVGEKTGKRFTLGDAVKFKVVKADLDEKTIDYELVVQ